MLPPRSPSPVALVGDTLPRWGRDRVRALCRGRRPRRPAAHGSDLLPPSANPQTPNRERRPRRSAQQHKTQAARKANPQAPHCRERACPFRAVHTPTRESPGECAIRLRIRPRLAGVGAFLAPSLQGNGCEFAERGGLSLVLLRNVGDDVPYGEKLRIRRTFMEISQLLRGRRDAAPYKTPMRAFRPSFPQRGIGVKLKKLEVNIIYVVSW